MPQRPRKPCAHPGCPELVDPSEKYCQAHKPLSSTTSSRTAATLRSFGTKATGNRSASGATTVRQPARTAIACIRTDRPTPGPGSHL